jgi:hypothetical protein
MLPALPLPLDWVGLVGCLHTLPVGCGYCCWSDLGPVAVASDGIYYLVLPPNILMTAIVFRNIVKEKIQGKLKVVDFHLHVI